MLDPQAQYDFLYSIQSVAEAWTEMKMSTIDEQVETDKPVIDFYDLIEDFRHKQRLISIFGNDQIGFSGCLNSSGIL